MTISPEYAEELGRQIDELEAENERLRSLIPTEPQEVVTVALKKLIAAVKTYQFTPDDCPEKSMAACDLDDAVDEAKAALAAQPPAAPVEMETCGICMGSGYSNHPDSGEICATCNGSGGVAPLQRLSAGMRP